MNDITDDEIRLRLDRAQELYSRFGKDLPADGELRDLLSRYREAIGRTGSEMRSMGVVDACTDCSKKQESGCCFVGIEDGYDEVLLLINLLLGCYLPDSRQIPGSCFFVGDKGCKLTAKFYFCLHYLCPYLQEIFGPSRSQKLLRMVGEELSLAWELERAIRRRIENR